MVAVTDERCEEECVEKRNFVKLTSSEARAGMKVRVREDHANPELRGQVGTVEHVWGHPSYAALDVRLGNGRLGLFWYYQLQKEER